MTRTTNEFLSLSKSKLLAYRQCPKRLWLQTYREDLKEEDPAAVRRMETGTEVGEIARQQYADGLLIEGSNLGEALEQTTQVLASADDRPLFEATFSHEGVLVRTDIVLPQGDGYHLEEVKSSTQVKEQYIPDAAIQAWVLRGSGLPVSRVGITHIDNSFVYPGNGSYRGLFTQEDVTELVVSESAHIPALVQRARHTLANEEPSVEPGDHCHAPYDCPFLAYCCPEPPQDSYPPEILPHGRQVAQQLRRAGYTDLRQVPEGILSNPRHQRVWRASVSGELELDPKARSILRQYGYPRYYMDFETIQFAIPIWAGTRPYQQIPFQWSCHRENRTGDLHHNAFLADGADDPRRRFIEYLILATGRHGPIFVYNAAFERTRLKELASAFPDLAREINSIDARIVDLLPITREHYYHPAMRGSWSIKAVLPTIAPEMSYDDLEIRDGGMAQLALLQIIAPDTSEEHKRTLKQRLLQYCRQDTLALVELARFLEGRNEDG